MNLHVISFFRDTPEPFVHEFMERVGRLRDAAAVGVNVSLCAVYGDSHAAMPGLLMHAGRQVGLEPILCEYNHGGPKYGSTEQPERLSALSDLANAGLTALSPFVDDHDVVWYVESDLRWYANTVGSLIDVLTTSGADAVAPLIFAGKAFYDIWGFRGLDGVRFEPFKPYHASMVTDNRLTEVSSVGSSFVMRGAVAKNVRIQNGYALVGFWEEARRQGYRVFVDRNNLVVHPS